MSRQAQLDKLQQTWDLIIIGGGITGAGIFREACRSGLKVLLLEQRDFGWGTSSRSSKLVHGGLRYIATGQLGMTRESVKERERLMQEVPELVQPLSFVMAHYRWRFPGRRMFQLLLTIYDLLARRKTARFLPSGDFSLLAPGLSPGKLLGGSQFEDALTDDARLVWRVIQEGIAAGGEALNYVKVEQLLQERGQVCGAIVSPEEEAKPVTLTAKLVINATGVWVDKLRGQLGAPPHMRPLRGSHLVFPGWRLPVAHAHTLMHPEDRRAVFIYPWQGCTIVGTTDLDHDQNLDEEASISPDEVDYLLAAVQCQFAQARITRSDIISTWSGVRPVLDSGKHLKPSKEKRDHCVWLEQGLLSVSGGKLTTFRPIAQDALRHAGEKLPALLSHLEDAPVFRPVPEISWPQDIEVTQQKNLAGRLGAELADFIRRYNSAKALQPVATTTVSWAELKWALEHEQVVHLDDLLLRRTRIGNLLKGGGAFILDTLKPLCQGALNWSDTRWQQEKERYLDIWEKHYFLPSE